MRPKWKGLAERLASEIDAGAYAPGDKLPHIRDLVAAGEGSKTTVSRAYQELEADGYVKSTRRGGTFVRDRRRVPLPVSRYRNALIPGGTRGPWETATAALGGRMIVPAPPDTLPAPYDVAELLGVDPDSLVVRRHQHAVLGDEVVLIQEPWFPLEIAQTAGLDRAGKIEGGIPARMKEHDIHSAFATEKVVARPATAAEARVLGIGPRVYVLSIERTTLDPDGKAIEFRRVVGASDRVKLVYDGLPIDGAP
jgi:GntR family transcriptional regulator